MIEVSHVVFSYNHKDNILDDISFVVPDGNLTCLLGRSGCGKSTILKLVERFMYPDKGKVHISFLGSYQIPLSDNVEFRKHIGYVCQSGNLLPHMSVLNNFKLQAKLRGLNWDELESKYINDLFRSSNFPRSLVDKFPSELSGGQCQRASIMKALIGNPPILLLDESFSALDPVTRDNLQNEICDLHNRRKDLTILMVTHDVQEALILADNIIVMESGAILEKGNPTELMNTSNQAVKFLLGIGDTKIPEIYFNSWRIAAIEKMKKYNSDKINVLGEDGTVIGTLTKSQIEKSLKSNKDVTHTLMDILNGTRK